MDSQFDQDFHFAILAQGRLYMQPYLLELFFSFPHPERLRRPRRGQLWLFGGVQKDPEMPHFKQFHAALLQRLVDLWFGEGRVGPKHDSLA
jgi:hypothetical protein